MIDLEKVQSDVPPVVRGKDFHINLVTEITGTI